MLNDTAAEITAQKGQVIFYDTGNNPHELIAGQNSLLVDKNQITSGSGKIDPNWLAWNSKLDAPYEGKAVKKETVKYLPQQLQSEGYELEGGQWVSAMVKGEDRKVWRPNVSSGWQPYVNGQWVEYRGEQTWVASDAEPFGYITYHYGSWEYLPEYNSWCWMPPGAVGVAVAGAPIDLMWCPGRVAWVSDGAYVGWVPLSYSEPYCPAYWAGYYGYYGYPGYYGPHYGYNRVDVNVTNVSFNSYSYSNRACFVNTSNFYGAHGGGYAALRTNVGPDRLQGMRASARLNATGSGKERFGSAKPASFTPKSVVGQRVPAARSSGQNFSHNQPGKIGEGQHSIQDHKGSDVPKFGQKQVGEQHGEHGVHASEGMKGSDQPKFGQKQGSESQHSHAEQQPKAEQHQQQPKQQQQHQPKAEQQQKQPKQPKQQ